MTKTQDRAHKATYARDKKKGGWLIRVAGPHAHRFAGRAVPVTMFSGDEHTEMLTTLIWAGADDKTGQPVSLYAFEPRPKEEEKLEF